MAAEISTVFPEVSTNQVDSISLFSGVAGFELGMEEHGHRPVMFCEIEPSARAVLSLWKPNVPIYEDVQLLDQLPVHGRIMCAGFPCTNLSQSGDTSGIFGPQSGLVRDVFRLLERRRVETVVLENVPNLIALHGGIGVKYITDQFDRLGYAWAYRCVDTRSCGRPQRRQRVFFVASLTEDPRAILLADDAGPLGLDRDRDVDLDQHAVGFYWTEGLTGVGLAVDAVPPLKAGSTVGIASPPAIMLPSGEVGTPSILDAEALQGLPADWTSPGDAFGRNARWRLVGNAVTTDIPAWLARRIAEPGTYDASGDQPLLPGQRWPRAGWNLGGGVMVSPASENPLGQPMTKIEDFLCQPLKPLSARATAGFISRARRGGLRFPKRFLERLDAHLQRMRQADEPQLTFTFA